MRAEKPAAGSQRSEAPGEAAEGKPRPAASESPLSLGRLREAFAAMLGSGPADETISSPLSPKVGRGSFGETALRGCEICPRSVVEAILFVGRPDNGAFSARELAAAMRGVSPTEIDAAVRELNSIYESDGSPYWIESAGGGFRMVLRDEFARIRDKFYGRVKEARLSPAVLEVLSVLAYNQPTTVERLNELRGSPCGAALATLVRRRLVRLDRPADGPPQYSTTDRFLQLFGLESLDALPRAEELEKA